MYWQDRPELRTVFSASTNDWLTFWLVLIDERAPGSAGGGERVQVHLRVGLSSGVKTPIT